MLCLRFAEASSAGLGHAPEVLGKKAGQETAARVNRPLTQSQIGASTKSIFRRIVQARLYQGNVWTLEGGGQTPLTVARTLSSLQPSFVTGLIRLPEDSMLSSSVVEAFEAVRSAVRASSKSCRFDVFVNLGLEKSPELLTRKMKEATAQIHPDAWTFHVPAESRGLDPELFDSGISFAHANGQMVGYDGPLSLIPEGVDFIVLRVWDLRMNRKEVEYLREKERLPLIVQLPGKSERKGRDEVGKYISRMTTVERSQLLTQLAENQGSWGYRLAYPVFYPVSQALKSFDTTKDGSLLITIRSLLARYD